MRLHHDTRAVVAVAGEGDRAKERAGDAEEPAD